MMRGVIVAVVLSAAVAAIVLGLQRRAVFERALDLQPGMPLAEVTAYLQRIGVEFTVHSETNATTIVRYGRKTARHRRSTNVMEEIVFDAQGRLSEVRTVAQITSP